jgi:metal-responsive CopG/Arc/MetJ family transcriptional regulator
MIFGGDFMSNDKINITLNPKIKEMLEKLAEEKGLKRSAIIAIAIEKYFREEDNRDKK